MQLVYYREAPGNFGDNLNEILWKRLLSPQCWLREDALLVGIGTIFNDWYLKESATNGKLVIVCGSGAGYSNLPQGWPNPAWIITAVRGPLTAEVIGRPYHGTTDAAILLALAPDLIGERSAQDILFIPHYKTIDDARWREVCRRCGFKFVDPRIPVQDILHMFARAKLVISEAMHGAIVADTLRIPWIPVECSPEVLPFKWFDWCQSMNLTYNPFKLRPTSIWEAYKRERVAKAVPFRDLTIEAGQDNSQINNILVQMFRERGHVPYRAPRSQSGLSYIGRKWAVRSARFGSTLFGEKLVDAAVKQLTEISKCTPVLSTERTYSDRLERMTSALEEVERLLE